MRANVKPLVHWAIYRGYKLRYTDRSPMSVQGILTTPDGARNFRYDPTNLIISVADQQITINHHGWELSQDAQQAGSDSALNSPGDQ